MCSVRGIGVALSVSTSTADRSRLRRSFASLLLVDHDQSEVGEADVFREQSMRADQHVDAALAGPLEDSGLLGLGAKARQHLDVERIVGHPFVERLVVLLGEDGGGNQDGNLPAVLDRLERRPDGELGLAEADVAA